MKTNSTANLFRWLFIIFCFTIGTMGGEALFDLPVSGAMVGGAFALAVVLMDRLLKGISLRAFSSATIGLLLGYLFASLLRASDLLRYQSDQVQWVVGLALYATFAARGLHCEPRPVTQVLDSSGAVLKDFPTDCEQVMPGATADAVNDILRGVMEPGGFGQSIAIVKPRRKESHRSKKGMPASQQRTCRSCARRGTAGTCGRASGRQRAFTLEKHPVPGRPTPRRTGTNFADRGASRSVPAPLSGNRRGACAARCAVAPACR